MTTADPRQSRLGSAPGHLRERHGHPPRGDHPRGPVPSRPVALGILAQGGGGARAARTPVAGSASKFRLRQPRWSTKRAGARPMRRRRSGPWSSARCAFRLRPKTSCGGTTKPTRRSSGRRKSSKRDTFSSRRGPATRPPLQRRARRPRRSPPSSRRIRARSTIWRAPTRTAPRPARAAVSAS